MSIKYRHPEQHPVHNDLYRHPTLRYLYLNKKGEVWSDIDSTFLTIEKNIKGYRFIYDVGMLLVSELMLETFVVPDNVPATLVPVHINGNKDNDSLDNLRYEYLNYTDRDGNIRPAGIDYTIVDIMDENNEYIVKGLSQVKEFFKQRYGRGVNIRNGYYSNVTLHKGRYLIYRTDYEYMPYHRYIRARGYTIYTDDDNYVWLSGIKQFKELFGRRTELVSTESISYELIRRKDKLPNEVNWVRIDNEGKLSICDTEMWARYPNSRVPLWVVDIPF